MCSGDDTFQTYNILSPTTIIALHAVFIKIDGYMDLNTVFLKYGHYGLCQTPSLKMARIVMLLKVTNNIFGIAIHQAIQQRQ